jgi:Inorganic pyrophosphatase
MMNVLIAPALGVLGLIAAFVVFSLVMRYSDGTDQVKKIGDEIHKGAMKFMKNRIYHIY